MNPSKDVQDATTVPVRRGQTPLSPDKESDTSIDLNNTLPAVEPVEKVQGDEPGMATVPTRRGQNAPLTGEPVPAAPPVLGKVPDQKVPPPPELPSPEVATVALRKARTASIHISDTLRDRPKSDPGLEIKPPSVSPASSPGGPPVARISAEPAIKPLDMPPELTDAPEAMHVMSMQRIRELRAAAPEAAPKVVTPAPPPPNPFCPRCQSKLTNPTTLGLCPKCGYCRSLEEDKLKVAKPGAKKKRRFSIFGFVEFCELMVGLPSWFWVLVTGFVVITGLSVAVVWYVPEETPWRSSWSTFQLVTGLAFFILAQLWALVLVAPHEERVSPKDLFVLSVQLWGLTWRRLPETRRPVWLACWGVSLAGYALLLIGGVSQQLPSLPARDERVVDRELHESVSRASPQQAEGVRQTAAQEIAASPTPQAPAAPSESVKDDRPLVTCRVIGFRPREDGAPASLILEIWRDDKLSYAGEVTQGVDTNDSFLKRLIPLKRQQPTVSNGKAVWIEPQYCDVHHSGFDDKGQLKDPRFKGWGKAPEKD